jgi:hypothetical protein
VCDVKSDQLQQARQAVNAQYQNQDCRPYHDFRWRLSRHRSQNQACPLE